MKIFKLSNQNEMKISAISCQNLNKFFSKNKNLTIF